MNNKLLILTATALISVAGLLALFSGCRLEDYARIRVPNRLQSPDPIISLTEYPFFRKERVDDFAVDLLRLDDSAEWATFVVSVQRSLLTTGLERMADAAPGALPVGGTILAALLFSLGKLSKQPGQDKRESEIREQGRKDGITEANGTKNG